MNLNLYLTKPKALLAAGLGFLFGGCAVLTVDVDVYKGALVNSPRIQTEQLAAMTMATRPLLLTLSNNLAKQAATGLPKESLGDSNVLDVITVILSLYNDNPTPAVSAEAEQAKHEYSNLKKLFSNENPEDSLTAAQISSNPTLTNALNDFRLATDNLIRKAMPLASLPDREVLKNAKAQIQNKNVSEADVDEVQITTVRVVKALSNPFDSGRPDKGLGTLISQFENYSATNTSDNEGNQALLVAVVDFAQKVKFIADNQAFIDQKDPYNTLALQATGNALLSLADTIARRQGFAQTFSISSNSLKSVEWAGYRTANAYLKSIDVPGPAKESGPSTKSAASIIISGNPGSTSFKNGAATTTIAEAYAAMTITNAIASIQITNDDASIAITNAVVSIDATTNTTTISITNAAASITTTNTDKSKLAVALTNVAASVKILASPMSTTTAKGSTTIKFAKATASIIITGLNGTHGSGSADPNSTRQQATNSSSKQEAQFPLPDMATNSDKIDIRAAQEMLIQSLRDIQVTATLNGDKIRATNALDALNLVMAYRDENIEILPAMSYLRNSYPATSLQQGEDGLWHNMLAQQGLRSQPWPFGEYPFGEYFLPWLGNGAYFHRGYSIGRNAEIQADIDKQFWQNINRVRVAGSGLTSYVITKDDIGNWYVKSYTANPSNIIEGAQSLIPGSKLAGAAKGAASAVSSSSKTNGAPNILAKVYGQIYEDYTNKTVNQAIDLTNFVAGMNPTNLTPVKVTETYTNVTAAYTNNFASYLAADLKTLTDSLAKPTNFTTIAKAQLDLLYQLKRFSLAEESKDTSDGNSYGCYVTNSVPTKLKRFAEDRLDTLKTYSAQLGVLSKAE